MEDSMTRNLVILALALAICAPAAQAQTAPDSENGRYSFSTVPNGTLRLDTRTGAVSICARKDAGWACNTVPDERQALDNEIGRLQRENGALKKEMLAHGLTLPGSAAGIASADKSRELNLKVPLPSDADIDRAMSALEKMWRRIVDRMQGSPDSDRI
jgi:hypothetical protein